MTLTPSTASAQIEQRLKELKIIIPELEPPVGLYLPVVKTGSLLITSGQLPKQAGKLEYKGRLGKDLDVETGKRAARLALVNALAAVKYGLNGNWAVFRRVVEMRVAVLSVPGFTDQSAVADGASETLVKVFGEEAGRHARFTWGVIELPLGASVELALTVEVKG